MFAKKLEFMRRGGRVKRFHGFHLLMENSVGHHSFNLITILMSVLQEGQIRRELLFAAIQHDLPECITGDLPAPFKRSVPGLREAIEAKEAELLKEHDLWDWESELDAHEKRWLKLADSLDGAMHCLEERRLGNTTLDKIFWTFMRYAEELLSTLHEEDVPFNKLWHYVAQEWKTLGGRNGPFIG